MTRSSLRLAACLLTGALASCSRGATAPAADPSVPTGAADYQRSRSAGQTSAPDTLPIVVCTKNNGPVSGSATIGVSGGRVNFGPHTLVIPPGALLTPTLISASTVADDSLVVNLQPHGLQFAVPAELALSYKHCDVSPDYALGMLYANSDLTKLLDVVPATDHYKKWMVVGTITHFSVYVGSETRKHRR